jgi:hypothetical protein
LFLLKKKRQIAPLHNKFWYNCTNYVKHTLKEPNFINPILSGLFHKKTYHWVLNFVDSKSKVIKIFIRMERKQKNTTPSEQFQNITWQRCNWDKIDHTYTWPLTFLAWYRILVKNDSWLVIVHGYRNLWRYDAILSCTLRYHGSTNSWI